MPTLHRPRKHFHLRAVAVAAACGAYMAAAQAQAGAELLDVTQRPFEELLNTEIITAAKLAQQISGAASAVSIVTAQDIRTYGYRTLDDVLSSMRGLHMVRDSVYGFLGGRGYSDPNDYAGRITLLIDGYSAADNYFGQSYFGQDAFLDVELIERVEYIPGGGSSDHGGGAFLGVINIVTKKGADFNGTQVALDFASHNTQKQRVTWGRQFDNGAELLLSASRFNSAGRNIVEDSTEGTLLRVGQETAERLFIKGSYQGWTLTSAAVRRPAENNDGQTSTDTSAFISLKFDTDLNPKLKLSTHAYTGQYHYQMVFGSDNLGNDYLFGGKWLGLDTKLVSTALDKHTLVAGVELRNDFEQRYQYHVSGEEPFDEETRTSRKTVSIYAYDDIAISPTMQLNVGLRHDRRDNDTSFTSPRAALIYTPLAGTTLKLSSGIAHMQPTADRETFGYTYRIERVRTHELVWEQRLNPATRLTSSFYQYAIDQRMQEGPDDGKLSAKGAEFELEHLWSGGSQLRASYAWQQARDQLDELPVNSPQHNAKFNFSTPLVGERLRLGMELHYLGSRLGYNGRNVPSSTVTNLALTSKNWWPDWQFSLSLRNAFDHSYADVGIYPRDGRNLWLQISRDFK